MQTKLVYVLTCAEQATYIEQALISIWSARYHNPDAHIVLLVDDKTNELLVGKRDEVLEYITEKVVIPFEDANAIMMYRSRWIKTQVRQLVKGDLLFIDCDTIVTQSLADADDIECEIGAVLDTHRPVSAFQHSERTNLVKFAAACNWDFSGVERYYSSGVLYVKDTENTHQFYQLWHKNYLHSSQCGVNIDQISMERAKQEISIISDIADTWNTIMFIRPKFIEQAKIIHFASLNNNSFLFSKRVLQYIKDNGLTEYIKYYVLHPLQSYLPYMKKYYTGLQFFKTVGVVAKGVRNYAEEIDRDFTDLIIPHRIAPWIMKLLRNRFYYLGTFIWLLWIRLTGKYNPLEWYYR
jgi:hypothetical protein